jgi:hypothetical protein
MGNAERKRPHCHGRNGFGAAKLLTMGTYADDIASRAKSYDLPTPIGEQPIQAHEASLDPVDVAFPIAFEEGMRVCRKMPDAATLQQVVGPPPLKTSH